jgi:nicotinamidase-related amidase
MKRCLVVVDYQNDFVEGSLGFEGAKDLDLCIYNKIMEYVKNNDDVFFTLDTHTEDYLQTEEGKKLPVVHCVKDTYGYQLYGYTSNLRNIAQKVFEKDTFGSLELAHYLRDNRYKEITFCGLVSNICVFSNAVLTKNACKDAKIIVDASIVGSNDLEMQEKSFDVLENLHIDVINRKRG